MPRAKDSIGPYQLINKLGKSALDKVWLAKKIAAFVTYQLALQNRIFAYIRFAMRLSCSDSSEIER